MKTWTLLGPGQSGAQWVREQELIRRAFERPPPQKTRHDVDHVTLICRCCARTIIAIALDEYAACVPAL